MSYETTTDDRGRTCTVVQFPVSRNTARIYSNGKVSWLKPPDHRDKIQAILNKYDCVYAKLLANINRLLPDDDDEQAV